MSIQLLHGSKIFRLHVVGLIDEAERREREVQDGCVPAREQNEERVKVLWMGGKKARFRQ